MRYSGILLILFLIFRAFRFSSSKDLLETFTVKIITKHFLKFSTYLVGSVESPDFQNNTKLSGSSLFTKSVFLLHGIGKPIYIINPWSKELFSRKHPDVIRYTTYSSLILITLDKNLISSGDMQKSVGGMSFPRRNEIIQKDKDYFIFMSNSESVSNQILLSHWSLQIKYKLGVTFQNNTLTGHSLCFYCNNGMPKVVELNLRGEERISKIFPDFTANFFGGVLRLAANTQVPAFFFSQKLQNSSDKTIRLINKRGLHAEMFSIMMKKYNFTYVSKPSVGGEKFSPGGSGLKLRNGTWIGCVGDVYSGNADIAMVVSPNTQRFDVVTFSTALDYISISFITAKPKSVQEWQSIFWAFKTEVWTAIAVASFLTGGLIYFTERKRRLKSYTRVSAWSVGRTIFQLFGTFLGQFTKAPNSVAGKVHYVNWLCFTLIVGVAYVSKLTSLIMLPGTEVFPRTLLELTQAKDFNWGASANFIEGIAGSVFKLSTNPVMRKLYREMNFDGEDLRCVTKSVDTKHACVMWDIMRDYIIAVNFTSSDRSHPFSIAQDSAFFVQSNWITRKREIFLPNFNKVLATARDAGVIAGIKRYDWAQQRILYIRNQINSKPGSKSDRRQEKIPKPFKVSNVQGSIYILLLGNLLSGISFAVEFLKSKIISHIRKDTTNKMPVEVAFNIL